MAVEENNPKVCKSSKQASKTVSESTIVVAPDPLSPILPTSSAMTTPDQQSPGPSASFLKSEETPENTERDPNTPEPAGKRDIQIKYSSD